MKKSTSRPSLLEVKHLSKAYGDKTVLKDINLELKPRQIYGLLSRNGAGKSTLIKLINTLLIPTSGEIKFKGGPSASGRSQKSPTFPNIPILTSQPR